jgi:serine/threonine protein kinase
MHASSDDLAQYLLGSLPEAAARSLQDHLATCDACNQTLCGLNPRPDTVVIGLRQPKPVDRYEAEPSCQEMVSRVSGLSSQPVDAASDQTMALPDETQRLRDYRLLSQLGAGGMGTVYKALHTKLDRVVAIKLLPPHKVRDAAAVLRFEREMKIVGQLEHPNIVRASDAGVFEGTPFLVMELVDGVDLDRYVREHGSLPIPLACEIVRQAALGLQHASERGVIHRDIKPSNLMLSRTADGGYVVKILDLGLAMFDQPQVTPSELTSDGQLMGTLDFMAPEQAQNTHTVDIRADIYSLGATLYKLLTGVSPFVGFARESVMNRLIALTTAEPRDVRELRADVPAALADFMHELLAKSPERRPNSPRDVAERLVPFANSSAAVESFAVFPIPDPRRVGRRVDRPWRTLVAACFLAGLAGLLVFMFRTRDGVVTVELDTPQPITTIRVDGHNVEWTQAGSPEKFRFQVRPGPVASIELLTEDGTVVSAKIPDEKLTIAAGKTYSLSASVERSPEPPAVSGDVPATVARNRDREVIEWVRSLGGKIGVGNPDRDYFVVPAHEPIPEGRLDLVTIDLYRRPIRDEDFSRIDRLSFLTTLIANETSFGDAEMDRLGELPRLQKVYLSQTKITNHGLDDLTRYPLLEVLHVSHTAVSDAGLKSLKAWPLMQQLFLVGCDISDNALDDLLSLKTLQHLNIGATKISAAGVDRLRAALPECRIESDHGTFGPPYPRPPKPDRAVAEWVHAKGGTLGLGVPQLGYKTIKPADPLPDGEISIAVLDLARCSVQDEDLVRIAGLADCTTLILSETEVTDRGIAHLKDLPKLQQVYLGGSEIGDDGLKLLAERFPDMAILHIGESRITDQGFEALRGFRRLEQLGTFRLPLTDLAVETLSRLTHLKLASVVDTTLTRDGIERLRVALPNCRIETRRGVYEPDAIDGQAALYFDGDGDYVDIPTLKYDGSHPITIEASVRYADQPGDVAVAVSNSMTADGPALASLAWNREGFQDSPHPRWLFSVKTGDLQAAAMREPSPRPVRLAGVWDGRELALYYDGRKVSFRDYAGSPVAPTEFGHFVIGAMFTRGGQYRFYHFKGLIDEVRISKAARYTDHYEPSARLSTDDDTLALYHFDEGEGRVLRDSSGNGHDGRIVGATWVIRTP